MIDKIKAFKDFVASVLGFGAAVGLVAFNEEQTGVILGLVSAVASVAVTFLGGGNSKDHSA